MTALVSMSWNENCMVYQHVVIFNGLFYLGIDSVEDPECSENKRNKSTEEIESKSWAELPHLVLTEIFSYLNRKDGLNASATCRHWRNNYFQPRLWDSLKIYFLPEKLDSARFLSGVFGDTVKKVAVCLCITSMDCLKECFEFFNRLKFNNNLRALYIVPVFCGNKITFEELCVIDFWPMRNALVVKLRDCLSNLDEFSLGCTPKLFLCSVNHLLENLNLSVKKIYLYHYKNARYQPGVFFDPALLRRFTKLQLLLIDWTQVSHILFDVLFEMKSLKKIIVYVESFSELCHHFASEFNKLEEQGVVVEAARFRSR
ncbi:uncharacterized protein [Leptinotarsa decemlineata]|uniref:uncharacterized protein n=1 Tax=Leptinotarsa decemlineata TaxID=7539 RepID=UPI003D3040A4